MTTTITLFVETLRAAATYSLTEEAADEFGAALSGYIERLEAALPEGVTLVINNHDLSTASLRDDDDQELANEISQRVEFWN